LQTIMQFVAVELCARRILPPAMDGVAAQNIANSKKANKPRMRCPPLPETIARHRAPAK
jgi:hypothetical protein